MRDPNVAKWMFRAALGAAIVVFLVVPSRAPAAFIATEDRRASDVDDAEMLHDWSEVVCLSIRREMLSPPEASRVHAYLFMAGLLAASATHEQLRSLVLAVRHLPPFHIRVTNYGVDWRICVISAFRASARYLIHDSRSTDSLASHQLNVFTIGVDPYIVDNSVKHGEMVANYVQEYSARDGYEPWHESLWWKWASVDSCWRPTPPQYLPPLLPSFGSQRMLLIEDAEQFNLVAPPPLSTKEEHGLWAACVDVVAVSENADEAHLQTALHWDDNPAVFLHTDQGNRYVTRHSPGSHWMLIASSVARTKGLDAIGIIRLYATLSMAMYDAFVVTWYYKYKYKLLRPVDLASRWIDSAWTPLLQTPSHPEYPSAHAVVSAVAAKVLTHHFGERTDFVDDALVDIGMPKREYNSFYSAAKEAAMSRYYGGVHYKISCEHGYELGSDIGEYVLSVLKD